ncbi:nicotinate-nucleotide pyrophosphorylase [Pyrodictium occultum]|uniref:Nicotinate-nucleotide pyrophosphorylase [carboxylating] n=1 Tax=Pyrodictium occultum TaxID=2309 RepID=A0A0V8RV26_PYROC|nr:carboxylating nicotinate-nucleotide diphosphorylase [Pyrodictium occultum]KSW11818.1 nicotinate-nucleotide pyrophosphorylase [Pyrodictium occultum]
MSEYLLEQLFLEWLREDAPHGDLASELLIPPGLEVRAVVRANERGVAACVEDVARVLERLGLEARPLKRSGETVEPGDLVLEVRGEARRVLLVERTLLNLLSYLFGVATATRELVEKARRVNPHVRVAATRKIPPGLRYLAKRAVAAGGGDTHRLSLSDAVLIKDNHLAVLGDVAEAVRRARERASFIHRVEVEVETVEDAVRAAKAGADVVMLDNMSPREVAEAIRRLEEEGLRGRVLVEVSGGITPENIAEYARAGPDVVSTSYITMKARPVDLSLEVVEVLGREEGGSDRLRQHRHRDSQGRG